MLLEHSDGGTPLPRTFTNQHGHINLVIPMIPQLKFCQASQRTVLTDEIITASEAQSY
jgi:hypothetical protein